MQTELFPILIDQDAAADIVWFQNCLRIDQNMRTVLLKKIDSYKIEFEKLRGVKSNNSEEEMVLVPLKEAILNVIKSNTSILITTEKSIERCEDALNDCQEFKELVELFRRQTGHTDWRNYPSEKSFYIEI